MVELPRYTEIDSSSLDRWIEYLRSRNEDAPEKKSSTGLPSSISFPDRDARIAHENAMELEQIKSLPELAKIQEAGRQHDEEMSWKREEFDLKSLREQQKDQTAQGKWFAEQWLSSMEKAQSDPAMKMLLTEQGVHMMERLSMEQRALIMPQLKGSVLDPTEQRGRHFDRQNPEPRITADPSKDSYAYADQVFKQAEWRARRRGALNGTASEPAPDFLGLGEGVYAIRGDNKVPQIVTQEELNLDAISKRFEIAPGKILAEGGKPVVSTQKIYDPQSGEHEISYHLDVLSGAGSTSTRQIGPTSGSGGKPLAVPDSAKRLISLRGLDKDTLSDMKTPEAQLLAQIKELNLNQEEEDQALIEALQGLNPGWNFAPEQTYTSKGWFRDKQVKIPGTIRAWPGRPVIVDQVRNADGTTDVYYYYQGPEGELYDQSGNLLSGLSVDQIELMLMEEKEANENAKRRGSSRSTWANKPH